MPEIYLLGTDEAGYGPNLGPLVIAASLWKLAVEETPEEVDLYEYLAEGITANPRNKSRVLVADSKVLYSAGSGLELLERGVLGVLATSNVDCSTLGSMYQAVGLSFQPKWPWYGTESFSLPCDTTLQSMAAAHESWQQALANSQADFLGLRAAVIQPEEFNLGCERYGNKAGLLSSTTLGLVREMIAPCTDAPVFIVCDKHGGRNPYAAMLTQELVQYELPAQPLSLRILRESREQSVYSWGLPGATREIRFVAKGERFLPAALASMLAKYLRELSMQAWNDYWLKQLPGLRPTAGYPQDAQRFNREIAPIAMKLGFPPQRWWRNR